MQHSRNITQARTASNLPPLNKTGIFNIPVPTSFTNYPPKRAVLINGTRSTIQSAYTTKSPYLSSQTVSSQQKPRSASRLQVKQQQPAIVDQKDILDFHFESIQGRRYSNEDAEVVQTQNNIQVAAIFDGHGGARVSKIAAQIYPSLVFTSIMSQGNVEDSIRQSIQFLESKVCSNRSLDEQGSTLSCVIIHEQQVYVNHVGDSRVILGMKSQSIIATEDHSPDQKSEIERLKKIRGVFISREFGISRVQGVLSLSRAVGDNVLKQFGVICEPDVNVYPLDEISYILIACDGLFNIFSNDQVDILVKSMKSGLTQAKQGENKDLSEIAINYCSGNARSGDLGIKKLTGLPPDRGHNVCDIDPKAPLEKRMCQVLVKMAYWLGSTDNITCMLAFTQ
ncbi:Protein phosphatase 2C [Spironucleus salmonicida]|uniref:Protein phosphatase 2C n=1 Tax=Spironucleus salmonicida TaxID=348837 RepID=V6LUS7_9EUKA|nr:Protein phosphatase 2C [Spironucleus salmonicida]|eukprot:EST48325.1 Protein phosphatase 2C [Spironucleus salmonicida]